jgi:hypothetical protein
MCEPARSRSGSTDHAPPLLLLIRQPDNGFVLALATLADLHRNFRGLSRSAKCAYLDRPVVVSRGWTNQYTSPTQPVGPLVAVLLGVGSATAFAVGLTIWGSGGVAPISPERVAEQLRWGGALARCPPLTANKPAGEQISALSTGLGR